MIDIIPSVQNIDQYPKVKTYIYCEIIQVSCLVDLLESTIDSGPGKCVFVVVDSCQSSLYYAIESEFEFLLSQTSISNALTA